jgi:hypothetical protein
LRYNNVAVAMSWTAIDLYFRRPERPECSGNRRFSRIYGHFIGTLLDKDCGPKHSPAAPALESGFEHQFDFGFRHFSKIHQTDR